MISLNPFLKYIVIYKVSTCLGSEISSPDKRNRSSTPALKASLSTADSSP